MRTITAFFLAALFAGSASAKPVVDDFHTYGDPDAYCRAEEFGTAIGWSEPNPWTDTLLCLNDEGLREITAPRLGGTPTVILIVGTASIPQASTWIARFNGDQRVELADAIGNGCLDGSMPFAVIPTEADVYQTGATIRRGLRLCAKDGNLVAYRDDAVGSIVETFRIPNVAIMH